MKRVKILVSSKRIRLKQRSHFLFYVHVQARRSSHDRRRTNGSNSDARSETMSRIQRLTLERLKSKGTQSTLRVHIYHTKRLSSDSKAQIVHTGELKIFSRTLAFGFFSRDSGPALRLGYLTGLSTREFLVLLLLPDSVSLSPVFPVAPVRTTLLDRKSVV